MMEVFAKATWVIVLPYNSISSQHIVNLKLILCHVSIKLRKKGAVSMISKLCDSLGFTLRTKKQKHFSIVLKCLGYAVQVPDWHKLIAVLDLDAASVPYAQGCCLPPSSCPRYTAAGAAPLIR